MANGIRTSDPRGFNKGRSLKFHEGSRIWQIPEEGRRTYRPKRYGNNNKDEDNSLKTLNDENHQASSQKFRQLTCSFLVQFWLNSFHPGFLLESNYCKFQLYYNIPFQTNTFEKGTKSLIPPAIG